MDPHSLELLDWEVLAPLAEGTSIDLQPLGVMAVLLHAESALPV